MYCPARICCRRRRRSATALPTADFAEAYEGLAVGFMSLGQDNFAAYYYNKLLMETDKELSPQNRKEIIDAFLLKEKLRGF